MAKPGIYTVNTATDPLWVRAFCADNLVDEVVGGKATGNKICPTVGRDPHATPAMGAVSFKIQQVPKGQQLEVIDTREHRTVIGDREYVMVPVSSISLDYGTRPLRGWAPVEFLAFAREKTAGEPPPSVSVGNPDAVPTDTTPRPPPAAEQPADEKPSRRMLWLGLGIAGVVGLGALLYFGYWKPRQAAAQLPEPQFAGLRLSSKRRVRRRRR